MKLNPRRVALLAGISLLAATVLLGWWLQKPGPYPCLAGRPSSLMNLMTHYSGETVSPDGGSIAYLSSSGFGESLESAVVRRSGRLRRYHLFSYTFDGSDAVREFKTILKGEYRARLVWSADSTVVAVQIGNLFIGAFDFNVCERIAYDMRSWRTGPIGGPIDGPLETHVKYINPQTAAEFLELDQKIRDRMQQ